jgi:peptidoglycan hydrolase-like protein with peptidoglycan-binding domain
MRTARPTLPSTLLLTLVALLGLLIALVVPAGTASGARAGATRTVATAATRPALPAAVLAASQPTLHQGDRGSAVVTLQKRLAALHYDVGTVDGIFGSSTLHGVYAFQKVQRIGIDGVVGPVTWSRLASPRVPKPKYTSSAAAIEIDLTLRVVYLTRSGAVTLVVDSSPGKPSTPTVTGSYSIYRRIDGWRESDLGLLWRPNYFHEGYALHGSTSVPTYAASHGCVRVTIPAMNRIWSQLFLTERVHVYR